MRRPGRSYVSFALLALGALVVHPATSRAELLGHWSFDGCSTTDDSGHSANLSAFGAPACTSGPFGNAWLLNGSDQFLARSFDPIFTPGTRSWSVAAWEKTTADLGYRVMVEWYRCGANPACNLPDGAYYILSLNDGHPTWDVRDDSPTEFTIEDTLVNVADGAWHLIVGTMNSASDSTKLYVDGALLGTLHADIGSLSNGQVLVPLEVGRHFRTGWGAPDFYFPGALDEVRIYDEELSAAAIAHLYTNNAITGVPQAEERGFAIKGIWPNPARGGGRLVVAFDLPAAEPARLAVFDIGGRLVARIPVAASGAGRHEADLGTNRALAPGVYMIQLTQGARSQTRRVTVLE